MKWHNNWILLALLVGFFLYWIVFFVFYGKIDQFIFPFDPEIYGTLSDWGMVLITAVTAFYIWRTLQSQTKVQEMQSRSVFFEEILFRNQILPKFEIKGRIVFWEAGQNIDKVSVHAQLFNIGGDAIGTQLTATISYLSYQFIDETVSKQVLSFSDTLFSGDKRNIDLTFLGTRDDEVRSYDIMVLISYRDIDNNSYTQIGGGEITEESITCVLGTPRRTSI